MVAGRTRGFEAIIRACNHGGYIVMAFSMTDEMDLHKVLRAKSCERALLVRVEVGQVVSEGYCSLL